MYKLIIEIIEQISLIKYYMIFLLQEMYYHYLDSQTYKEEKEHKQRAKQILFDQTSFIEKHHASKFTNEELKLIYQHLCYMSSRGGNKLVDYDEIRKLTTIKLNKNFKVVNRDESIIVPEWELVEWLDNNQALMEHRRYKLSKHIHKYISTVWLKLSILLELKRYRNTLTK